MILYGYGKAMEENCSHLIRQVGNEITQIANQMVTMPLKIYGVNSMKMLRRVVLFNAHSMDWTNSRVLSNHGYKYLWLSRSYGKYLFSVISGSWNEQKGYSELKYSYISERIPTIFRGTQ